MKEVTQRALFMHSFNINIIFQLLIHLTKCKCTDTFCIGLYCLYGFHLICKRYVRVHAVGQPEEVPKDHQLVP